MGVDAVIMGKTAVPLSDEELASLNDEYVATFCTPTPSYCQPEWFSVEREKYDNPDGTIIDVSTMYRFYGPGYTRGPWPNLRGILDWLTVRLGEQGEVRYGGDTNYGFDELRPYVELRDEYEKCWQEVGHNDYWPYRESPCKCDHCVTLPMTEQEG